MCVRVCRQDATWHTFANPRVCVCVCAFMCSGDKVSSVSLLGRAPGRRSRSFRRSGLRRGRGRNTSLKTTRCCSICARCFSQLFYFIYIAKSRIRYNVCSVLNAPLRFHCVSMCSRLHDTTTIWCFDSTVAWLQAPYNYFGSNAARRSGSTVLGFHYPMAPWPSGSTVTRRHNSMVCRCIVYNNTTQ